MIAKVCQDFEVEAILDGHVQTRTLSEAWAKRASGPADVSQRACSRCAYVCSRKRAKGGAKRGRRE